MLHTPGPWKCSAEGGLSVRAEKSVVCTLIPLGSFSEANADFISLAPVNPHPCFHPSCLGWKRWQAWRDLHTASERVLSALDRLTVTLAPLSSGLESALRRVELLEEFAGERTKSEVR